eukprot:scaffold27812_cov115-Amphora_coffeaeformis.AAC.1
MGFDNYYTLLSSAAAQYDAHLQAKPKRMIYSHDIEASDFLDAGYFEHDLDHETYDIDTPVSYIQANVAARPFPPR